MTRKTTFLDGWSWFKFNNLGLAKVMTLKLYTCVAKGLKLKASKFFGLSPTFVEVTGEKLVGGTFLLPFILNTVKEEGFFAPLPSMSSPEKAYPE